MSWTLSLDYAGLHVLGWLTYLHNYINSAFHFALIRVQAARGWLFLRPFIRQVGTVLLAYLGTENLKFDLFLHFEGRNEQVCR